jgi:hypothetical protein
MHAHKHAPCLTQARVGGPEEPSPRGKAVMAPQTTQLPVSQRREGDKLNTGNGVQPQWVQSDGSCSAGRARHNKRQGEGGLSELRLQAAWAGGKGRGPSRNLLQNDIVGGALVRILVGTHVQSRARGGWVRWWLVVWVGGEGRVQGTDEGSKRSVGARVGA